MFQRFVKNSSFDETMMFLESSGPREYAAQAVAAPRAIDDTPFHKSCILEVKSGFWVLHRLPFHFWTFSIFGGKPEIFFYGGAPHCLCDNAGKGEIHGGCALHRFKS